MEILVSRDYKKDEYTIGNLYVNGVWVCNTLEDTDRGLDKSMKEYTIKEKKVYGKTAIPTGKYEVTIMVESPKFSKYPYYKKVCNGRLPRLLDVPGYEGILMHCLTPDMEILTESGWMDLEKFKKERPSKCYSMNTETMMAELVDIDNFIEQEYNGYIYSCNGKRINYSVTDKHRMFVNVRKHDSSRRYEFRTADNIPDKAKFITAINKDGDELTSRQKALYLLIMAVQADGYILNYSKNSSSVRFHFTKERKINRVIELIEEIGCEYKKYKDCEGKIHIILEPNLSNEICEYMNPNRYLFNYKELPIELLNLKSSDLKDLIMEYLFFDGRYSRYLKNNHDMVISSTNINTLNTLQSMACLCGMRSYIHKGHGSSCYEFVLYENQSEAEPEKHAFDKMMYNGTVWCLSNKNTTLIVRKNNRPMIIGNCGDGPNGARLTEGCILVGRNLIKGGLLQGKKYFELLYAEMELAHSRGEKITLEVK